ncbi:MAG: methylenetetrahydrofolate reductase [NAD(P)H] [Chloroflexi bacterium]|nr:methylenetetrahydrofolate reductase [NAD(P)H] [Chloroflexota bacterium]
MTTSQTVPVHAPRRIADALRGPGPVFSFEFFPPKTPGEARLLERTIGELVDLRPTFVSVTDRAGSAARGLTREVVARIGAETGLTAMAHLTCASTSRDELHAILSDLRDAGIVNVLALRGDPPRGETSFVPPANGFRYGSELIGFIRGEGFDFCLGSGCYPEGHSDSELRADDLANLKRKVEVGAEFLITQLFLDNAFYFDFVARAREAGITVPIIPGIMPITNFNQIPRFVREWGATVPFRLQLALERCDTPEELTALGVRWATAQCHELLARGAPGVHFYTLNRSTATRTVLEALRGGTAEG